MRVLITGCARSGTTLMVHLMRYFYNTDVVFRDEKHPHSYRYYNPPDRILVIKKPIVERNHIGYFSLSELLVNGWHIIFMMRDGLDVITSVHDGEKNYVSPSRWVTANEELIKVMDDELVLPVRYESLVSNPDKEMDRIAKFIGQDYQPDYKEFYTQIDTNDPMNVGVVPRPIDTLSVGKKADMPEDKMFQKLTTILGYERM
jgi:hypothetical protein